MMFDAILMILLLPAMLIGAAIGIALASAFLWLVPNAPEQIAVVIFAIPFLVAVIVGYSNRGGKPK